MDDIEDDPQSELVRVGGERMRVSQVAVGGVDGAVIIDVKDAVGAVGGCAFWSTASTLSQTE